MDMRTSKGRPMTARVDRQGSVRVGRHLDHLVAFGVEGDRVNARPVSGGARPTRRVAFPGLEVQRVARRRDGLILSGVALLRADVADATVTVINVVPTHELGCPGTGFVQSPRAPRRELRAVLGRAEQRLGKRVVIAHTGSRLAVL